MNNPTFIQLKDNHFGVAHPKGGGTAYRRGKMFKKEGSYYVPQPYTGRSEENGNANHKIPLECRERLDELCVKTVGDLKKEGVIIWPPPAPKEVRSAVPPVVNDDFEKEHLFEIVNDRNDRNDFYLDTSNVMGVLRYKSKDTGHIIQVEIGSRFDRGKNQLFLNYLLSKVFDVNLTSAGSTENPNGLWEMLLALVFKHQFQEAVKIGLFKQYRRFDYNDLNFKGKIDFARHLRNYPLNDRIAYSRHEITFDNPIMHLLRSAIDRIERKWPAFFSCSWSELRQEINKLKQNTPSWERGNAARIMLQRGCREQIRHPFFAQYYEPLRKTALGILRDEGVNTFNDDDDHELEGVLFDGAWLWESYVATLLETKGFIHGDKNDNSRSIEVFEENKLRFIPDFWRVEEGEPATVLDTKYKYASATGVRTDIHQVLCYMFLMKAQYGGLIFPPLIDDEESEEVLQEVNSEGKSNVKQMTIATAFNSAEGKHLWENYQFTFPDKKAVNDANAFLGKMKEQEENLFRFLDRSRRLRSKL